MGLTRLSLKRPDIGVVIIAAIIVIRNQFHIRFEHAAFLPIWKCRCLSLLQAMLVYHRKTLMNLVSQEIEEAGGTLKGLKNIQSTSAESMSMVMFQYEYGTDMDDAYMDLLEALNENANQLPSDAGTPRIIELNVNSLPTVMISASAEGDIDLLNYIENDVVPELERITDVAEVEVSGGKEAYVSVSLNPQKMAQYGLSMSTVCYLYQCS